MAYTENQLAELSQLIAKELRVSSDDVFVTPNSDGTLTASVGNKQFTGTREQILDWVDGLVREQNSSHDDCGP